ncbi:hypothetical protein CEXT_721771 [Caerostris extrusa]|uniref:Uncharacterized protein n=1 Tax=Caerostris extrusa TaxID=172846 RepID=A0AAV4SK77_CAEEX|nr:hypothetical protein CEXT_721771 [Caerostris extrusa]
MLGFGLESITSDSLVLEMNILQIVLPAFIRGVILTLPLPPSGCRKLFGLYLFYFIFFLALFALSYLTPTPCFRLMPPTCSSILWLSHRLLGNRVGVNK